jgi:hypothetical protein
MAVSRSAAAVGRERASGGGGGAAGEGLGSVLDESAWWDRAVRRARLEETRRASSDCWASLARTPLASAVTVASAWISRRFFG